MPVRIASKTDYAGTLTLTALNTETAVVDIGAQLDDYIVEGHIDVAALASGDTLVVTEYIAIDGTNYRVFNQVTLSGAQASPAFKFHSKILYKSMKYRVTLNQTAGTPRSFGYAFILQVLEVL